MKTQRLTQQFQNIIDLAVQLATEVSADALMILLEGQTEWDLLRDAVGPQKVLLAADFPAELEGAGEAGFPTVVLNMPESPVHEKLTQALLESVADDILAPARASLRSIAASRQTQSIPSALFISMSISADSPLGICGNSKRKCRSTR